MRAQVALALDNLETVLDQAGLGLGDVVRLNYYTTDVDGFINKDGDVRHRIQAAGEVDGYQQCSPQDRSDMEGRACGAGNGSGLP